MKKQVFTLLILIGLLVSCKEPNPADKNNNNNNNNSGNGSSNAAIVFDNTNGISEVTVYSSHTRNEESIIKVIPAGQVSSEIAWQSSDMYIFYFSWLITIKDVSGFAINYVPVLVSLNQAGVRIDPNKTTEIIIPKLEETISPDSLLTDKSFLLIQNNSSFSFTFVRGMIVLHPDNISATLVNSRERALYTVDAGSVTNYNLLVGGNYITLSDAFDSFEPGFVYSLIVEGTSIHRILEREVKLGNVSDASVNNVLLDTPSAPSVIAGDGNLMVSWMSVTGAQSYEVYVGTNQSPPAQPARTVPGTVALFTGLNNKTTYFVWIKAVNAYGSSDHSFRTRGIPWPSTEAPAAPGRPLIIPGMNQVNVIWEACGGAESYEVYIRNFNNADYSSEPAVTTDKTNAVIDNLENGVIYIIQVRAVNSSGKSDFSPEEAGTPIIPTVIPDIPSRPELVAGNKEINVSWQNVYLAQSYEVWYGTSSNSAQAVKFADNITDTKIVITGLTNETLYYVWIKATNNIGTTSFSPAANVRPSLFSVVPDTPQVEIINGSKEFRVSWDRIEGAKSYEIFINTIDNRDTAVKFGGDYETTSVLVTNRENGTTYYVWVRAKNDIGASGDSDMAIGEPSVFNAPPSAPAAAPVLITGTRQISVSWHEAEGALLYEVWIGTSENSASAVKHGADTDHTSMVITGLNNGTAYHVWIKAKNGAGTSGFSPPASAVPSDYSVPPAAPSAPAAVIGDRQIEISWNAVAGAINYEVWIGTAEDSASMNKYGNDIAGSLYAVIGDLSNGTVYYIRLKAKNNAGASGFSPYVMCKPIANANAPSLVSRNSQIDVSWTAIAGAELYEVFYGTGTNPPQTPNRIVDASETYASITGLTNGATYNVWIRGINSSGRGAMSDRVHARPIGNMGTVTVTTGGVSGQLVVSWSAVAGAEGYEVYRSTENSIPVTSTQTVFAATIAELSGLENGKTHYIWVIPINANGKGEGNAAVNVIPLAAPGGLTVRSANQQVTLSWNAVTGAQEYEIYYSTLDAIPPNYISVTGTERVIPSLINGTTYHFWVKAKNENGTGSASTRNGKPIGGMGNVSVTVGGSGQLILRWDAVAGADLYEIYQSQGDMPSTTNIPPVGETTATIGGLSNGVQYNFWVMPKNDNGSGVVSAMVSGTPIAAPAALSVAAANQQITLSWGAVSGATGYEIYFSTSTSIPPNIYNTVIGETSAVISGLNNGTNYNFWVKARNNGGAGTASQMATGTPLGNMGSVEVTTGASGQLILSWGQVAGALRYDLFYSTGNTRPENPNLLNVTALSSTVGNLVNGTSYNFWVIPKNNNGQGLSNTTAASGKPIAVPGAPNLTAGFRKITVSWSSVTGADQYEVYYGTTSTPTTLATTTSGTSYTINNLANGTTYYVRLCAKNNTNKGSTDYGASSFIMVGLAPGLYKVEDKIGDHNLADAYSYLSFNAQPNEEYIIVIGSDEEITSTLEIRRYSDRIPVAITLLGYEEERTISFNNGNFLISVGSLTIDANITLDGRLENSISLVNVTGGNLIMKEKSIIKNNNYMAVAVQNGIFTMDGGLITGNRNGTGSAGVFVSSNGKFIMNGGIISENYVLPDATVKVGAGVGVRGTNALFTMNGGEIKNNSFDFGGLGYGYGGGGVGIRDGGSFIMNGGVISGNSSVTTIDNTSSYGGGVFVRDDSTFTMNDGTITENTADQGGGVYISINGQFTMFDGKVSKNISLSSIGGGGGVYIFGGSFVVMNGTISGNTGGGVFGSTVATSDGIYTAEFFMHGGRISGNTGSTFAVSGRTRVKKIPYTGQTSGIIYGAEATGYDADGLPLRNSGGAVGISFSYSRSNTAWETDQIDSETGRGLSANGNPPYGQ